MDFGAVHTRENNAPGHVLARDFAREEPLFSSSVRLFRYTYTTRKGKERKRKGGGKVERAEGLGVSYQRIIISGIGYISTVYGGVCTFLVRYCFVLFRTVCILSYLYT